MQNRTLLRMKKVDRICGSVYNMIDYSAKSTIPGTVPARVEGRVLLVHST